MMSNNGDKLNRRAFLQSAAMLVLASGVGAKNQKMQEKKSPKIVNYNENMKYRRLGETDIFFSVLSLGGIGLSESIGNYAIDRGINLIHMSPTYRDGRSILELTKVLKGKREKVYIAIKDSFYKGSPDGIDEVLKTLKTDYIDFIMINRHNASRVDDVKIYELYEKWKSQGKVHYLGLTTHDDVKECVHTAIKTGKYHLIMPALNQPALENMAEELREADKKGIGIMAMKTLKGIRNEKLQIAFLKKLMQNPAVTTVTKGINTYDMLDDYIEATQQALSTQEDFSLYRYSQQNRSNNCMMCGECKKTCPQHIEISTVLRCKMYYHDQQFDKQLALSTYQSIPKEFRFKVNCKKCRKCEDRCPNGIAIIDRLQEASSFFNGLQT